MDIPTTMTPIQLSLIWLLMGLLLTWMIVFALLANKRAPWTLRRPKRSLYRAKRATGEDGESGDDNVDASVALPYSETSDVIDAYDEKIKNP